MRTPYILGLTGSALLALGVFAPIISLPIVGSVNYFMNGRGDGALVLILAFVSIILTFRGRYEWLLTTGVSSLAMLVFTFIKVQTGISSMHASAESQLAGNPFRGLADVAMQSVQIQWGWIILVVGSALIVAAAVGRNSAAMSDRKCPFCAEPIKSEAKICKHCKSALPLDDVGDSRSIQAPPLFSRRVILVTLIVAVIVPLAMSAPQISWMISNCSLAAFECV